MHPPAVRAEALALVEAGLNDCEISRRLGIPRRTILDWRPPPRERYVRQVVTETCPRCWQPAKPMRVTPEDYAELLGFYLGDGCISDHTRTQRLRISLDTKYPGIVGSARALLKRCFPHNPVDIIPFRDGGVRERLRLLLPSRLPPPSACAWNEARAINRTGPYEYLSYDFTNHSKDIVDLFTATCDLVGLRDYRVNCYRRAWKVRINRRGSVARMVSHVGVKS